MQSRVVRVCLVSGWQRGHHAGCRAVQCLCARHIQRRRHAGVPGLRAGNICGTCVVDGVSGLRRLVRWQCCLDHSNARCAQLVFSATTPRKTAVCVLVENLRQTRRRRGVKLAPVVAWQSCLDHGNARCAWPDFSAPIPRKTAPYVLVASLHKIRRRRRAKPARVVAFAIPAWITAMRRMPGWFFQRGIPRKTAACVLVARFQTPCRRQFARRARREPSLSYPARPRV